MRRRSAKRNLTTNVSIIPSEKKKNAVARDFAMNASTKASAKENVDHLLDYGLVSDLNSILALLLLAARHREGH